MLVNKERNPGLPGIATHSSGNHGQAAAYAAGEYALAYARSGLSGAVSCPDIFPMILIWIHWSFATREARITL